MILPVILAGGSGTRLWPLSRDRYPKQLLKLVGGKTMLQHTISRCGNVEGAAPPLIICNESHRFFVGEDVREMKVTPSSILLEPVGRNTAPAVAAAAWKALDLYEDPLLLILPADHHIEDTDAFAKSVAAGLNAANKGFLVTFGIEPLYPETGYGYIHRGDAVEASENKAYTVRRFVEKPDEKTAGEYVASGEYFWNSGMFLFKASVLLKELERYAPSIVPCSQKAVAYGALDLDFFRLERAAFASAESISLDYAVMEKTDHSAVVVLNAGWSDLGSWEALYQIGEKDADQNVITGDVLTHDTKNSLLHGTSRAVCAVGLSNHIVIETSDAILVSPRDRVQDVRHIVGRLKREQREEALSHKKVYRPWGSYESIDHSDRYQVKRINVKPGARLSLQKHHHRSEHWIVVQGVALATRGEETIFLKEDESVYIPQGVIHRLENPGKVLLSLIEVQTGTYLGEDDIVRFEDDYGRQEPSSGGSKDETS